jgi:hypothetical protein
MSRRSGKDGGSGSFDLEFEKGRRPRDTLLSSSHSATSKHR